MKYDELSERLLLFAVRGGKLASALPANRLGRHVAGQLMRAGTAGPPNYEEARAGESRADFIHKLSIVLKELRESRIWLRFIILSELLKPVAVESLLGECEELCRIIGKSIVTAKTRSLTGQAPGKSPSKVEYPTGGSAK
jgi:four helix bundle protein